MFSTFSCAEMQKICSLLIYFRQNLPLLNFVFKIVIYICVMYQLTFWGGMCFSNICQRPNNWKFGHVWAWSIFSRLFFNSFKLMSVLLQHSNFHLENQTVSNDIATGGGFWPAPSYPWVELRSWSWCPRSSLRSHPSCWPPCQGRQFHSTVMSAIQKVSVEIKWPHEACSICSLLLLHPLQILPIWKQNSYSEF